MNDLQLLLLAGCVFVARTLPAWASWIFSGVLFIAASFVYGRMQ